MINETNLPIAISEKKLLPGHDPDGSFGLLILDHECKLRLTTNKENTMLHSDDLNTRIAGEFPVDLKCSARARVNLGVSITSEACDSNYSLFTKMIVISPRFILLNETGEILLFSPIDSQDVLRIYPHQRDMLHFQDSHKEKLLSFTLEGRADCEWEWSGSIDCTATGEFFPILQNKQRDTTVFYKALVSTHGPVIYIEVVEQEPIDAAFQVHNKLDGLDIEVHQIDFPDSVFRVPAMSKQPVGWREPTKPLEMIVRVLHNQLVIHSTTCSYHRVGEQLILLKDTISNDRKTSTYSEVTIEGKSRILSIFSERAVKTPNALRIHFYFKFKNIGLALLAEKKELLYATLNSAFFAMKSDGSSLATQFRVKTIEIDNNISRTATFGVALYPKHLKRLEDPRYYNLDIMTQSRVKQSPSDVLT